MLLVEVRRAFPEGWFDIGYTLSDRKSTSDASGILLPQTDPDSLDLDTEWGPTAWDERHRLVATGGLDLPLDLGLVAKVIYASARPFTAITGRNDNGDLSLDNDGPPGGETQCTTGTRFLPHGHRGHVDTYDMGTSADRAASQRLQPLQHDNGDPSSVRNNLQSPLFGETLAAFPGRRMEVGLQARWN